MTTRAPDAGANPWPLVSLLYLGGVFAAAQLGKLSALSPLVAASMGLSLPVIAIAISLIEVGGATLGAAAGLLAQRLGLSRTLRGGIACLAIGGIGGALAQGELGLFGWRLLEAAGYLGVIVSAPVLIAHGSEAAGGKRQAMALTLWSTFVPVGLAVGAWGHADIAALAGWRAAAGVSGGLGLLLWAVLWRTRLPADGQAATVTGPGQAQPSRATLPLRREVWWLVLAFGCFALFEIGVLALLPTLLVREAGLGAQAAGQWTAVAALSAVGGSVCAAWLLRHGQGVRWPIMASLGLPPLLLFGVFAPSPGAAQAIMLVILLNMLGGVFASLGFALLPRLARGPGQMVRANGLLAQCGASGSLLGPPLMASCVQFGGWTAAALFGLVVSLAALPLAWRAASAAQDA